MSTFDRSDGYGRALLVAVGLTLLGIIAQQLSATPALLVEPALATDPTEASRGMRTVFMALNFVGFFIAGAVYLWWTDRGLAYIDVSVPDLRGWAIAVGAFIAAYGAVLLTNVVAGFLDIDQAQSNVLGIIGSDPTMVLIMIAIVFLFNAPAEEFLFRGIIQKRLYDAFTKFGAVLVTSAIFTLIHFPVYYFTAPTTLAGISVVMIGLFIGSIIFGYSFVATDNLVVPTLAHALFNAIQFSLLYLVLVYGDEEDIDAVAGTLLEILPALGV